jgi:hypothetical protein
MGVTYASEGYAGVWNSNCGKEMSFRARGGLMKLLRLVLALSFAATFAHVAAADSTDPFIGLGGTGSNFASCSESESDPTCVQTGPTLTGTVTTDDDGGAIVDVENATGNELSSVTVVVDQGIGNITCQLEEGQTFFGSATPTTGDNGCVFSGTPSDGVGSGVTYGVYFGEFTADSTLGFTVASASAPEPGSIFLLGMGLLSLFAVRKWRGTPKSA